MSPLSILKFAFHNPCAFLLSLSDSITSGSWEVIKAVPLKFVEFVESNSLD
jgi:hypothetical protein